MSKQQNQTGTTTAKPTVPGPVSPQKTAPLPLDLGQLRQVSGGTSTPVGRW